jgi:hypothetical protein
VDGQRSASLPLDRIRLGHDRLAENPILIPGAVESCPRGFYPMHVKAILALGTLLLTVVACRGPGGPMERAGRSVDNAVYDVGTGIKKAGQKVQKVAE